MINSLYQVNSYVQNLTLKLSSNSSQNQLKKCIQQLVQQVKYFDQNDKANYYYLISQIYATKFKDYQQAQSQLEQLNDVLKTQILMNCQLRFAFYKYFQKKYQEAQKSLINALRYIDIEIKLTQNARFFFNRVINKPQLQKQSTESKNLQAIFILSFIYEHEQRQNQAITAIQSFINQSQNFQQFEMYKRFLQLYEVMKRKNISTLSISKKTLDIYKKSLDNILGNNPQYEQIYQAKSRFIIKILQFMNKYAIKKENYYKKLLELKLLAYYKLIKASKLASNKNTCSTLQNTAISIKFSKDTQFLQQTLDYTFVQKEYQIYKVFHKYEGKINLLKWHFFNNLCQYQNSNKKAVQKQTPRIPKPIKQIKASSIKPLQKPLIKQYQKAFQQQSSKVLKPQSQKQLIIKGTQSQFYDQQFQGSIMIKINASSDGSQQRYFYVRLQTIQQKPRLYYCNHQNKQNQNDSYYSLKGLTSLTFGKNTQPFQRKDTENYKTGQCFSMIFGKDKDRNFYVPNSIDYHKWIYLLQTKILGIIPNLAGMKNSVMFSKIAKNTKVESSQSGIRKSRKVVQI